MAKDEDRGVPRGDHAPKHAKAPRERGNRQETETDVDQRAHGAPGKGDAERGRVDDANVEPGDLRGVDEDDLRGADAWGSEGSGGSVIDKRPPENKKGSRPSGGGTEW